MAAETSEAHLARAPRRFLVVRAAVKGAARAWVCLRRGAEGCKPPATRRAVGVCAKAPAARALLRRLSGRLRRVGVGWAGLARGSWRPGKALRGAACHWCGLIALS